MKQRLIGTASFAARPAGQMKLAVSELPQQWHAPATVGRGYKFGFSP